MVGVHVLDPAHEQPGVSMLGLGLGRERGVLDLGDIGVGDPALLILIEDLIGVLDRRPRVFGAMAVRTVPCPGGR